MKNFTIPKKHEISAGNQLLLESFVQSIGFVPNLYSYLGKNDTALADYMAFQNRKSTLSAKEREVINLVVSQVNQCIYSLAAHTAIAQLNGFTEEEILEIRGGHISFDPKLAVLSQFVREATVNRGRPSETTKNDLFESGYTEANLIDIIMVIGDKIISNYLYSITHIELDFPAAPELP